MRMSESLSNPFNQNIDYVIGVFWQSLKHQAKWSFGRYSPLSFSIRSVIKATKYAWKSRKEVAARHFFSTY